jgi:mannosyl-oligosaccharide alpha-1,3-glucosidase
LPSINVLGFHFSKWAPVSADMVLERSQNFTKFGFPVDVLWMDIEHALWTEKETVETRDYRWFTFNPFNYSSNALSNLKEEIERSQRRLVTIIDPHINAKDEYFVYQDGLKL